MDAAISWTQGLYCRLNYSPPFVVLQSQVSNNIVDLLAAIDELGEAVFLQLNTSHVIASKNIGET